MAKTLYLDCFSGASGDMLVGSLLDLGFKLSQLEFALAKLDWNDAYHLHADRESRLAIEGVKFTVHVGSTHHAHAPEEPVHTHGEEHGHDHDHTHEHGTEHSHEHKHGEECGCGHDHGHEHAHEHDHEHEGHEHSHDHDHTHGRNFAEITKLITDSGLSDAVKGRALNVFRRVAVAEGKIHGLPPEKVTFHEVGAADSIIDIVGFCVGLEKLGVERVLASPLVEGTGWVKCAHGRYPVPTTATLEILKGIPLSQTDEPHELLTPTGAAILAEFAESFAPLQNFVTEKVGYGLGTRHLKSRPNVVRAILGATAA
jgi:uncharacterized protein (DUF111 family)